MMTKKHYERIAEELADLRDYPWATIDYDQGFRDALDKVAERLSDIFEDDNPNFKREHFLAAANTNGA